MIAKRILNFLISLSILLGTAPLTGTPNAVTPGDLGPETLLGLFTSTQANSALLRFDSPSYQTDDCAGLVLYDDAFNNDLEKSEEVSVELYTRLSADREDIKLTETGPDTGEFRMQELCIPVVSSVVSEQDQTLQVNPGDMIGALHYDVGGESPRALALATIAGGQSSGAFELKIDPGMLPQELISTPSVPGQPDFPLAMVVTPDNVPAFFGEDQVIIRGGDQRFVEDFLKRRNGQVMNAVMIPAVIDDQGNEQEVEFLLVRLDPSSFDEGDMPYLMELIGIEGTFTYSSLNAAKLIAMLLEEQFAGNPVFPHGLGLYQGAPVGNDDPSIPGPGGDVFTLAWFSPTTTPTNRVMLGQTLTLMEAVDLNRPGRPFVQTTVALVDGGFASPADYAAAGLGSINNPDYGDINGDGVITFNEIPQCDISPIGTADCSAGSAAGPNPLPCSGGACPWHGTNMAGVAGAEFNNGSGSAGSGAHAVSPMFIKVPFPYILPAAAGIREAVVRGAQVINLSSGFPCRALVVDACEPLQNLITSIVFLSLCELIKLFIPPLAFLPCDVILFLLTIPPMASAMEAAVRFAESRDVIITAAAGNNAQILGINFPPQPPQNVRLIPCILGNVICVGEIVSNAGGTDLVVSGVSAFGNGVDIYAPGSLARTLVPQLGGGCLPPATPGTVCIFGAGAGTSGASAFAAGVVALMRSINPTLPRATIGTMLLNAGCRAGAAGRTPPMPACTPSAIPLVNTAPGGFIDVFEAVRSTLATTTVGGVSLLEPTLAACTGGWDETLAAADTSATALNVPLSLPLPGDSFTTDFTGDLSIHGLGTVDQDWYRFQLPEGMPTGSVRVSLSTPTTNFGTLTYSVFANPPSPATLLAGPVPAGTIAEVSGLMEGATYFIQITAPPPTGLNDNCYGGTSLTIELVRLPDRDRFAGNDSPQLATDLTGWEHTDWLCGDEIRRALGDPDLTCPRVFEDGIADRAAKEVWSMQFEDLTIDSRFEEDFFHVNIPDPGDPAQGGHDDIRSTDERATLPPTDPVPLPECGVVQREEFGLPALDNIVNVFIGGKLIVQVVPTSNRHSVRPVATDGETVGLYRRDGPDWIRNDDILGTPPSPTLTKILACPRTSNPQGLSMEELVFSFGERPEPRSGDSRTGGYEVILDYVIEIERGVPDYVPFLPGGPDDPSRVVGRMPCIGLSPFIPDSVPGSFGSFIPNESFPLCHTDDLGIANTHLVHPVDASMRPVCLAGGPGCDEYFLVRWPATESIFDVIIEASPALSFQLLNADEEVIAEALPINNFSSDGSLGQFGDNEQPTRLRLNAGQLEADLYVLLVSGTEGEYTFEFEPPEVTGELMYLPFMAR